MCTLALYFQEFEDYPLIIAANRDEYFTRPSAPPQMLASDPLILGGKDLQAGGTWLGINQHGLFAGILNRRSSSEKRSKTARSRGLLCLDILTARDPLKACELVKQQKIPVYQPFTLLFANAKQAYVAYNEGREISWIRLEKGLHVLSNTSYVTRSKKVEHAHPLFSQAQNGVQRKWEGRPSWIRALKVVLSDHVLPKGSSNPKDSICVHTQSYGTVSSSIIFYAHSEKRFYSYHTSGPPCRENYGEPLSVEVL